jgi:hypothetical protein
LIKVALRANPPNCLLCHPQGEVSPLIDEDPRMVMVLSDLPSPREAGKSRRNTRDRPANEPNHMSLRLNFIVLSSGTESILAAHDRMHGGAQS